MNGMLPQLRNVWRGLSFCFVLGAIALLVGFATIVYATRTPNYRVLREQGDSIVMAVEQHRATAGEYPEELDDVGFELPETQYGQWHYTQETMLVEGESVECFAVSISTKDQSYSLWRPWFTMHRWNHEANWHINTDPY